LARVHESDKKIPAAAGGREFFVTRLLVASSCFDQK
jgi:hypothetical protein